MKCTYSNILSCLIIFTISCSPMAGPDLVSISPSATISKIVLSSNFVMMQIGDTHTLSAEIKTVDQTTLTVDLDKATWLSEDTSKLEVDRSGRLKAKATNSLPTRVIVSYRENLNTVIDTVQVYITPDRIDGSSAKLIVIDSNRVGAYPSNFHLIYPRVRVDILDGSDNLMVKGAQIPIQTPAPVTNKFNPTGGKDKEPVYSIMNDRGVLGRFWVMISVNLYGEQVSDSVQFTGLYPITTGEFEFNLIMEDVNGFVIPRILDTATRFPRIQPCGVFKIMNFTSKPIDVVFSDSTSIGTCEELSSNVFAEKVMGGNILNLSRFGTAIRRIRTTGVVDYYLRDAVTKERLPVSGRYESVELPD